MVKTTNQFLMLSDKTNIFDNDPTFFDGRVRGIFS
jgi:hypothetical protein